VVGGDLRLKWAENDVHINTVGADATVREVQGNVSVGVVGADLYLRNIEGSCRAENVGSDLVLNIDFHSDHQYHFNVNGDVLCRVQPETNARFYLPLEMPVSVELEAQIGESEESDYQVITMGDGGASIFIDGSGELRLVGEEEDYVVDLGIQIEEELEARLSNLEEKLNQQLEGLDERIAAKTEYFASQAERFAERMASQAQRQAERAQRHAERATSRIFRGGEKPKNKSKSKRGRHFEFEFAWDSPKPRFDFQWGKAKSSAEAEAGPRRPVDPVTEQERLMILTMVQEGKISIEEAERLLSALEGQD
jgi:hypothetical protein